MAVTRLTSQAIRNLGIYGVIRSAEVNDSLIPDGAVTDAWNVHFDRKGAVSARLGIAMIGSSVYTGYPAYALYNTQTGTLLAAYTSNGSAIIYAYSGASWASNLTGGSAYLKPRFVNFAGKAVCTNFGYAANMYDSIRFWNEVANADWATTGNPINPQQLWPYRFQFIEVYKNRLYVAGDLTYKDRLFYSSVISSAGNLSWDTSSTGYWVDINPSDGENITALKRFSLELLVFKPNYIYRFRTSGIDPDPLIKIGTRSQDSVVEGKNGVYFHHESGFYRYSGGYPEEISRPISDLVAAITYANYGTISAWKDGDHIYWSVGNLTVNSESLVNVVLRYTESAQLWTAYKYATSLKFGTTYNSSSALTTAVATGNGLVATLDSGYSDIGESISFRVVTKWYEWDSIVNQKTLDTLYAYCDKAQGTQLFCQTDDNDEWEEVGTLTKFMNRYDNANIRFHRLRFKLVGISNKEPSVFFGLDAIEGINEGMIT
jgi:hypothetical protein